MTELSTISSQILYYTCLELRDRGIRLDRSAQWKSLATPVLKMRRPRVTFAQSQALIREALHLSGDPDLGLAVGRRQSFASSGLLATGLLACPTYADAVELGVKYHRLTGSMLDLRLRQAEDGATALTATSRIPSSPIMRFLIQEMFANVTQISRFLYRAGNPLQQVDLIFDGADPAAFRSVFGCPVYFRQSENRLVFRAPALSTPLETADAFALNTVLPVLDALVHQERDKQTLLTHIETLLLQQLSSVPPMSAIARELGMSERSLRRKLNDSGTSYRDILSRVRQTRAMELMHETNLPLATIAHELGFEDTRSLRRGLLQWTGRSARALRQDLQAE